MPSAWRRLSPATRLRVRQHRTIALLLALLCCCMCIPSTAVALICPPPELEAAAHEAVRLYRAAITANTAKQETHAVQLFRASIAMYPLSHAYNNLGLLLFDLGDREALATFIHGAKVAQEANETETLAAIESNIGFVLRSQNMKSVALCLESIGHFDRALAIDPLHVQALYNKAAALYELREFGAAETLMYQVLALEPNHVAANMDLGGIFYSRSDITKAVHHQGIAIANAKTLSEKLGAIANKGSFLRGAGLLVQALEAFEEAYALASGDSMAVFNLVIGRRPLCAWHRIDELHDELIEIVDRALSSPSLAYTPLMPFEAMLLRVSDAFRKRLAVVDSRQTDQAVTLDIMPPRWLSKINGDISMPPETPLRIGYLSYDFRDHPMGQLILGFLESHDAHLVETFCYSYGPNDASKWRKRAEKSCRVFRDVAELSDLEAAKQVALDQVDILIDLMAHTTGARIEIPSLKPSRIIVNYLGYPGTTGSSATDFVIVDKLVVPPERARAAMTEQVVYLPTTYQSNLHEREPQGCLEPEQLKPEFDYDISRCFKRCPLARRADHGLPKDQDVTVFCNFNTLNKMEPVAFALWLRILRRVPSSVLWLLTPSSEDSLVIMSTLLTEAQAHGVHPSRVIFAPWETKRRHMARLTLADIFLDSLIYNAHSTASDALWASVPIVTLWGDTFPSRVAASLIQNALPDFPELTPHSIKEYEELAVLLAQDRVLLGRYRHELGVHALRSPLFDSKRTTESLERSYELMHDLTHHVGASQASEKRFQVLLHPESSSQSDANTELRIQTAVGEGLRHQRAGHFQVAKYFYSLALQSDQSHGDALHLLATLHFERGDTRIARTLMRKVADDHPDVALYRMNVAVMADRLGDVGIAVTELQQVLRLEPSNTVAFHKLIEIHFAAKDFEAMVQLFKAFGGPTLFESPVTPTEESAEVSDWEREQAFLSFSYALAMVNREHEAIELLQDAIMKHQTYYRVGYNLVAMYNRLGRYREGEAWHVKVVLAEAHFSFETRGRAFHKRPRLNNTATKVVAIYCHEYGHAWWGQWGPSSLETGLGGSEEAVVFLSAELQKLGYWVEIYGDPPEQDITPAITPEIGGQERFTTRSSQERGVAWYPHYTYDPEDTEVDIFIAWRYHGSLVVGQKARSRYLWMHDIPSEEVRQSELLVSSETGSQRNFVSGILCVSAFQASFFPSRVHQRSLIILTTNGLDSRHFMAHDDEDREEPANLATNFVYGSAPNRGLEHVLRAWPQIRKAIPEARLTVFYGFTQAFERWGSTEIPDFAAWKHEMEMMLQTLPGVHYAGLVGHEQLAREYSKAGFYLYPTTFGETSSVTLMKAMASGAIPITSRYKHSALEETCAGFDLGPAQALDEPKPSPQWLTLWVESVVSAVRDESGRVRALRSQMKAFARAKYRWSSVAEQWHQVCDASRS